MLQVLYHHAKFRRARTSPAAGMVKSIEFCLFVCLALTVQDRLHNMQSILYR